MQKQKEKLKEQLPEAYNKALKELGLPTLNFDNTVKKTTAPEQTDW